MTENVNNNTIILASSITTGLLLLLLFTILIVVIITTLTIVRLKQHRGNFFLHYKHGYQFNAVGGATGVIDHVPVDDNPAYITMKRITLNKNTAYETVNKNETVNTSAVYETVL